MKSYQLISAIVLGLLTFSAYSQDGQPITHEKTYNMLPGQTLNIVNKKYRLFEVRSDYPVQLLAGSCHSHSTVQWRCSLKEPNDLFIRDLRSKPVFSDPKANVVIVSVIEN